MAKIDLKKELKELYNPPREPVLVDVPPLSFLMVDGSGYPGTSQEYQEAMEVLYGMAYTLKFKLKRGPLALDHVVMPLEGLWWAKDMDVFLMDRKEEWLWTSMIMQPREVTKDLFEEARDELGRKKGPPALPRARLEVYEEGASAQVMYLGPYSEEGPTIEALHAFIEEGGHRRRGKHHEIYLGDPRRTAPERLRTIIRQPYE